MLRARPGEGKQSSLDALSLSRLTFDELLKAEESSEMALNMINQERERREIESLLPWCVGILDRRDTERIERALAGDGDLRSATNSFREELAETIRLNEMIGAPSARAMEKLFAAIDAEKTRAPRAA